MSKCDSFHVKSNADCGECWGTREREWCYCGGDPSKCDFYPEKREKYKKPERPKIIAVDFDGTLCENKWPDIGEPNWDVIKYCKDEQKKGAKIILWTCRDGVEAVNAIMWCLNHGLNPDACNSNIPQIIGEFGGDCRKIFADEYIDDKACTKFKLPYVKG